MLLEGQAMSKSLAFWIIYLIAIVLTVFLNWPLGRLSAQWLVIMLLIGIIGWAVFGAAIK